MTITVDYAEPMFGIQVGKVKLRTHSPDQCAGEFCCIHNPSDHPMREWRMNWRADRYLMERICPTHGVGHPDPDHMAWVRRTRDSEYAKYHGVHGCCGCEHA